MTECPNVSRSVFMKKIIFNFIVGNNDLHEWSSHFVDYDYEFLCIDAKEITEYFDKGEVDRIYLNFSDPWPKDRHAKRRLPSRQFLSLYDVILKKEGTLEFKTDNRGLFDFAVEELEPAGWKAEAVTYDLHNDEVMNKDNIMTEYEEKFSSQGNPIFKYIISR